MSDSKLFNIVHREISRLLLDDLEKSQVKEKIREKFPHLSSEIFEHAFSSAFAGEEIAQSQSESAS